MSIIYEALQKTQRQLNTKNQSNKPKRPWVDIILIVIILILLIATLVAYYPLVKTYLHRNKTSSMKKPISIHSTSPSGKLILNGIFISDNERVAQINGHLYSVGERVAGNQILEISANAVKLQGTYGMFYLESPSMS